MMLSKTVKNTTTPPPLPRQTDTLKKSALGTTLKIVGNVFCSGEVDLLGSVEGDIQCDTLFLGEGGTVQGNITAKTVRLCGTVTGDIIAQTVFVTETARIIGDITHDNLSVEHGAHIEGRCVHPAQRGTTTPTKDTP